MTNLPQSACLFLKHSIEPNLYLGVSRKYQYDQWGLVGGKKNTDETIEECIIRECKEECGLDLINPKPIFTFHIKPSFVGEFDLNFECTTFTGEISGTLSTLEPIAIGWLTKEQLLNGPFGDYNKALFEFLEANKLA